jgi:hypothetical protein
MWRIDSGESLIDRSALLQPELGADLGIWRLSVLGTGWWRPEILGTASRGREMRQPRFCSSWHRCDYSPPASTARAAEQR